MIPVQARPERLPRVTVPDLSEAEVSYLQLLVEQPGIAVRRKAVEHGLVVDGPALRKKLRAAQMRAWAEAHA